MLLLLSILISIRRWIAIRLAHTESNQLISPLGMAFSLKRIKVSASNDSTNYKVSSGKKTTRAPMIEYHSDAVFIPFPFLLYSLCSSLLSSSPIHTSNSFFSRFPFTIAFHFICHFDAIHIEMATIWCDMDNHTIEICVYYPPPHNIPTYNISSGSGSGDKH